MGKKLLHIVGARPQFMKLYPLLNGLKNSKISSKILHTGQHYDGNMSDVFFKEMGIPKPDFDLKICSSSLNKLLEGIVKILNTESFDGILVYGDTNTTLAGALAGREFGLKVIHYESGVRNFDPKMPEEINRIIVDRISDILLCVSQDGFDNLKKESCWYNSEIYKTGDLMYDSFLEFKKINKFSNKFAEKGNYVYCTIHRENNTNNKEKLNSIVKSLNEINKIIRVVFPVHPRRKKMMEKFSLKLEFPIFEPFSYNKNLKVIEDSNFVITDSGGVVREAYWSKKPSILLVENPLWPELIKLNACVSSPSSFDDIMRSFSMIKKIKPEYNSSVLGDGKTSQRIVRILLKSL